MADQPSQQRKNNEMGRHLYCDNDHKVQVRRACQVNGFEKQQQYLWIPFLLISTSVNIYSNKFTNKYYIPFSF